MQLFQSEADRKKGDEEKRGRIYGKKGTDLWKKGDGFIILLDSYIFLNMEMPQ